MRPSHKHPGREELSAAASPLLACRSPKRASTLLLRATTKPWPITEPTILSGHIPQGVILDCLTTSFLPLDTKASCSYIVLINVVHRSTAMAASSLFCKFVPPNFDVGIQTRREWHEFTDKYAVD